MKKQKILITGSAGFIGSNIAKKMNFRIVILSKGPKNNPEAYTGKKRWIEKV